MSGPDAEEYLHRLCTQDIRGLGDAESRPAAFLNAKGKLVATCRVGRAAAAFWIEVAIDQRDMLVELLQRYHFSEQLELTHVKHECHELVGAAEAMPTGSGCLATEAEVSREDGGTLPYYGVVMSGCCGGLGWVRAYQADGGEALIEGPTEPLDAAHAERLRIVIGRVAVGRDTDATTLGMEAHLDDHISVDKGCYTGQEIVARIQTYGHVNRRLVCLQVAGAEPFDAGTPLIELDEGDPVGRAMTSELTPEGDARVALGYLPKDFWEIGTELRLGESGGAAVRVIGFGEA